MADFCSVYDFYDVGFDFVIYYYGDDFSYGCGDDVVDFDFGFDCFFVCVDFGFDYDCRWK